ncbi:hypothetical protein CI109_102710 [Kwoniella shandongensis]|uniref:Zn(2)-C6 fungal-type domain-containing protein n=1 Tax=Kwoniella shandongensis TaxID=1734106 RepID=A0AAJ8MUS6_9TREE
MPPTASMAGRAIRSKKNRPCDHCRKQKHMCNIPASGPPCVGCEARNTTCTFVLPPTHRKRAKRKAQAEDGSVEGTESLGESSTSSRLLGRRIEDRSLRGGSLVISSNNSSSNANEPFASPLAPIATDHPIDFSPLSAMMSSTSALGDIRPPPRPPSRSTNPQTPRTPTPRIVLNPGHDTSQRATSSTLRASSQSQSQNGSSLSKLIRKYRNVYTSNPSGDTYHWENDPPNAPVEVHTPLDNDPAVSTAENETYFMGLHAVPMLPVADPTLDVDPEALSSEYRQVSDNPKVPAIFSTKNPTLLYGRLPFTGSTAWSKVLERVGLMGAEDALRTCIVAHTTTYNKDLRPYHIELWSHVLQALEDEYRAPRLQTLQIALLIIGSRPNINSGQNSIAIARAVGLAYLLGLHVDCSGWRLPLWERKVRLRVWWALVIHDSWHSLVHGRPSILSTRNDNVPLPTIDDSDWGDLASVSDRHSMESFIAICICDEFYTVSALLNPHRPATRLRLLETIGRDLDGFDAELPASLRITPDVLFDLSVPTASGVRSMQLVRLGLTVVVLKLTLGTDGHGLPTAERTDSLLEAILDLGGQLATFLEILMTSDFESYWLPYSPNLVSEAVRLLLTGLFQSQELEDHTVRERFVCLITRVVTAIALAAHKHAWDVAMVAIRHMERLFSSVKNRLEEVRDWERLIGPEETNDSTTLLPDTSLNFSPSVFDNLDLGSAFGAFDNFSDPSWLPEADSTDFVFPDSMF